MKKLTKAQATKTAKTIAALGAKAPEPKAEVRLISLKIKSTITNKALAIYAEAACQKMLEWIRCEAAADLATEKTTDEKATLVMRPRIEAVGAR